MADKAIVQVENLKKYYHTPSGVLKAVDGVSFQIPKGTAMGLVGESGCGKSTTGRLLLRLAGEKTGGKVFFEEQDIYALSAARLRRLRPKMQLIFQDPLSSLSPRLPVGELIAEGVREHQLVSRQQLSAHVDAIMESCGLQPFHKSRYPHEFSGGQRQRICIARALALNPDFLVCDEPVSALDVSVQAQIVNLLKSLQAERGLTYLFISHDLSVVEHMCDRVAVMYLGRIVEQADTDTLYKNPMHPYTKALFSAIPIPDPDKPISRMTLAGSVPSPIDPPKGCPFHPRCPHAMEICTHTVPALTERAKNHLCACHLYPTRG